MILILLIINDQCLSSLFLIAFLRFFYNVYISESKVLISSFKALAFSFITRVEVEAMLTGFLNDVIVFLLFAVSIF